MDEIFFGLFTFYETRSNKKNNENKNLPMESLYDISSAT
jgi:hypothetical protein